MSSPEVTLTSASLPGDSPYVRISSLTTNNKSPQHHNQNQQHQQINQEIIYQKTNQNIQNEPRFSLNDPNKNKVHVHGGLSGSLSLPPVQLLNVNHHPTVTSLGSGDVIRTTATTPEEEGDEDPFVVTVRQSPGREKLLIAKSASGSFISGGRGGKIGGGSGNGPRLALYRSNSSLDLLDRENYLLHHPHHSHLHQLRLSGGNGGGQQSQINPQINLTPRSVGVHSHAHQERDGYFLNQGHSSTSSTGGCFPRRKDFGSHGSIDVLAAGPSSQFKPERSGSLGNAAHFLSLLGTGNSNSGGAGRMMSLATNTTAKPAEDTKKGDGEDFKDSGNASSKKQQQGNSNNVKESSSPRLRLRKLWESKEKPEGSSKGTSVNSSGTGKSEASIFRKLRGSSATSSRNNNSQSTKSMPEGVKFDLLSETDTFDACGGSKEKVMLRHGNSSSTGSGGGSLMEERFRRRVLAHHDCQSVSANISYAARLRGILAKRRNTTTGASAASLAQRPLSHSVIGNNGSGGNSVLSSGGGGPSTHLSAVGAGQNNSQPSSLDAFSSPDPDLGDEKSNALVLSCPYFRNEVGGEKERVVSLSRLSGERERLSGAQYGITTATTARTCSWEDNCHRSFHARGVALLELPSGVTHWNNPMCPFSTNHVDGQSLIEAKDLGATYYRRHFHGQDHENWFGLDESLGPLAVSVKKEKGEEGDKSKNLYRLIVRSSELNTIRGSILEDSVPGVKLNSTKVHAKEIIEFLLPEVQLSCLKLGVQGSNTEDQLLKLDEQGLTNRHKVGIMYCKAGQATEEEMYNNEVAGPAFTEFLDLIGQRIRLKGFDKYTGGLDNKDDSTGLYSVYSKYQDCEVIFHVSTLLPFTPNNRQQLMRKRHIGNDIVTIVFQEPGALPFTPKSIRSQFQHVFIIVRAINPCSDSTYYSVSVSRSREVPLFGPPIPQGAKFPRGEDFVEFLLAKVINAENATYRSEKFTTMATRTRQEYLKDLVANYSTNSPIDPRPKFSMFGGNKKKEMIKPKFNGDGLIKGALSWTVWLDESSTNARVEAYLAISIDSIVLIDFISREPIFAIPCASVLAWNTSMSNRLRVYYHQGECFTIYGKEKDNEELLEIVTRLEKVTNGCGCETHEFILRRVEGTQLGFHVQQDGVITEVEPSGCAAKAGIKQGSRLVEICKVAVATLTQDEMIEMLKTSSAVILTIVPPLPDNSPRRVCSGKECTEIRGLEGSGELYENIHLNGTAEGGESSPHPHTHFKQNPHRKKYEPRGFSPPRSSNSSGYGTGSSSKSFSSASTDPNFQAHPIEGETLISSSNGLASEDQWYEAAENMKARSDDRSQSPPPIPARNNNQIRQSPSKTPPRETLKASMSLNHTPIAAGPGLGVGVGGSPQPEKQKPFTAKREFFHRSSPHHNSFHTKLSPSRSHDMLHLKNLYGLNQPLRPFLGTPIGVNQLDKNKYGSSTGFIASSTPLVHGKLTREHSSLGVPGEMSYSSSIINNNNNSKTVYGAPHHPGENTVRGKVTYLTDYPLGHSLSTEHMASVGLPQHKDVNALKNERVAALKSAYLDKHRDRSRENNSVQKADSFRPMHNSTAIEDSNANIEAEKPKQGPVANSTKNTPNSSEVKLRPGERGSSVVRTNINRSSTLQEDLLRLISPEYLVPHESVSVSQVKPRPASCNNNNNNVNSTEIPSTDLYSTRASLPNPKLYQESPTSRKSYDDRSKRHSLLMEGQIGLMELNQNLQQRTPNGAGRLSNGKSVSPTRSSPLVPLTPWIKSDEDIEERSVSPAIPLESVLNLEARVTMLEAELRKEQESKELLAVTVASLQQENRRLQHESHSTQKEFCKFKEWLLHSVDQGPTEQ